MRSFFCLIFVSLFCAPIFASSNTPKMFQVGPFSSLMEGGYEGYYSINDLPKEGNFGIGIFSNLKGEMIAYKGQYYAINEKGQAKIAKKGQKVPYAQVIEFNPEFSFEVKNLRNYQFISEEISEKIERKNLPCAVLIKGKFAYLKLRSLKAQKKPFQNFYKASQNQAIYHFEETSGYAIGFWYPSYWKGVTSEGYNFSFIDDHFKRGGHVLDMHLISGEIYLMPIQNIELYLPKNASFEALDLNAKEDGKIKTF